MSMISYIIPHHTISYYVTLYRTTYIIIPYHTTSYHIILSYYYTINYCIVTLSYHINISYYAILWHTISYHISYHIIIYHTLSYHIINFCIVYSLYIFSQFLYPFQITLLDQVGLRANDSLTEWLKNWKHWLRLSGRPTDYPPDMLCYSHSPS